MAIEDILSKLPKVFGTTPEVYRGLLEAPEQAALENRANIGGLLGFAGALAQGMSPQGYRRSAAQNILTALGAGYGAAGQTYESGLNQVSNVMKLAQAKRQISGLAAMRKAHPDLAYIADVSPDEFVRQVSARERAKRYGLLINPSAAPVAPSPEPAGLIASDGGGFMGGGYGSVGVAPVQPPAQVAPAPSVAPAPVSAAPSVAPSPAAPIPAPSAAAPSATKNILVNPQDQAQSDRLYAAAVEAELMGDKPIAEEYRRQAKILNPDETITFRDGILVSSRRGVLMKVLETKTLTPEESTALRLPTDRGQVYQRDPSGKISRIEGTESTELDKAQLIKALPGQFTNIYPTLQNRANNLISRAPSLTKDQINEETKSILEADSKILADLDPKLQAAEMARRKSGKTDLNVYTGALSKTAAGEAEKALLTSSDAITRLNSIKYSFTPEYQKTYFKASQAWSSFKDKWTNNKLSDLERNELVAYSKFRQNSLQNLNQTIKEITGAAMSDSEAKRITASLPDPGADIIGGDSPTEFKAKLDNSIEQTKYAILRKEYALRKGLKWENIALEKMPSIIQERGKQIEKEYKLDPKDPATKATVLRQLSAEFGVQF